MARPQRKSPSPVGEKLFLNAHDFDFHQALRILDALNPRTVLLGEGVIPMREVVSLKSRVFLDPAPSQLSEIKPGHRMNPATLGVNFFGLAGESGPLPMAYVEMILDRVSHRDYAWVDFLDIFNHRLLSLVARNGRKHWPVLGKKKPHEVPLGRAMVSLCGMTCLESAEIPQMSLQSFLPYATVFWNRRSTESGLVGMLRDFFQVPVQVTPFVGCWRQLPRHVTTRIGDGIHLGNNHRLGESATLGTRYWDQGGRIQVNIGPIDKKNWKQFLPTGLAWPRLHTLIRAALSPHMDVRVKLEVEGSAFKGTRLNGQHALGWQTPLGKVYKEKQEIIVHHHFLRQE